MFTPGTAVALDVPACMEPHFGQFHSISHSENTCTCWSNRNRTFWEFDWNGIAERIVPNVPDSEAKLVNTTQDVPVSCQVVAWTHAFDGNVHFTSVKFYRQLLHVCKTTWRGKHCFQRIPFRVFYVNFQYVSCRLHTINNHISNFF